MPKAHPIKKTPSPSNRSIKVKKYLEPSLCWTEKDLPEKDRTKHVHRLHPYLGKFVPQLVEFFLVKYLKKGQTVYDPFVGSGTTLVEANTLGLNSIGCDISAFNCLISRVKTQKYEIDKLENEVQTINWKLKEFINQHETGLFTTKIPAPKTNNEYINAWFASSARDQLLYFRNLIEGVENKDFFNVVLSRAARSSRLTYHHELDFPKIPIPLEEYDCRKHFRKCRPTEDASKFLLRYNLDALKRVKLFSSLRSNANVQIIQGDSREVNLPSKKIDAIFTSPPYVGLIDYHEQHRYAYEILELKDLSSKEIGPASSGTSQKARDDYQRNIRDVLKHTKKFLKNNAIVMIVVNDKHDLYEKILEDVGLVLLERVGRDVNRRTGRRNSHFTEEILVSINK